jgi:hypothetical protein
MLLLLLENNGGQCVVNWQKEGEKAMKSERRPSLLRLRSRGDSPLVAFN